MCKCWVSQTFCLCFPVRYYKKTWMNFLAKPNLHHHPILHSNKLNMHRGRLSGLSRSNCGDWQVQNLQATGDPGKSQRVILSLKAVYKQTSIFRRWRLSFSFQHLQLIWWDLPTLWKVKLLYLKFIDLSINLL